MAKINSAANYGRNEGALQMVIGMAAKLGRATIRRAEDACLPDRVSEF